MVSDEGVANLKRLSSRMTEKPPTNVSGLPVRTRLPQASTLGGRGFAGGGAGLARFESSDEPEPVCAEPPERPSEAVSSWAIADVAIKKARAAAKHKLARRWGGGTQASGCVVGLTA